MSPYKRTSPGRDFDHYRAPPVRRERRDSPKERSREAMPRSAHDVLPGEFDRLFTRGG